MSLRPKTDPQDVAPPAAHRAEAPPDLSRLAHELKIGAEAPAAGVGDAEAALREELMNAAAAEFELDRAELGRQVDAVVAERQVDRIAAALAVTAFTPRKYRSDQEREELLREVREAARSRDEFELLDADASLSECVLLVAHPLLLIALQRAADLPVNEAQLKALPESMRADVANAEGKIRAAAGRLFPSAKFPVDEWHAMFDDALSTIRQGETSAAPSDIAANAGAPGRGLRRVAQWAVEWLEYVASFIVQVAVFQVAPAVAFEFAPALRAQLAPAPPETWFQMLGPRGWAQLGMRAGQSSIYVMDILRNTLGVGSLTEQLEGYTERLAARNLYFGGLTESTSAWCEINGANYTWEAAREEERVVCHIGSLGGYYYYGVAAFAGIMIVGLANVYAAVSERPDPGARAVAPITVQREAFWWLIPWARPNSLSAVIASSFLYLSRVRPERSAAYTAEWLVVLLVMRREYGRYRLEVQENEQEIARRLANDTREAVYELRTTVGEMRDEMRDEQAANAVRDRATYAMLQQILQQNTVQFNQMWQYLLNRPEQIIQGAEVRLLEGPQDCSASTSARRARSAPRRRRSEGARLQEGQGTVSSRTRGAGARR